MTAAIEVRALDVARGGRRVVHDVALRVEAGRTLALLGPNGAGKTTIVGHLTAHLPRLAGEVRVLGEDPTTAGPAWRAQLGLVPQETGAFVHLTPRELVGHLGGFYPDAMPTAEVLARLDLDGFADRRIGALSGGQRRRVDLACAIVGRPRLLFLDEPTTGLDPGARRALWALLDDLGDTGTAVLLTTHHLEEVEALADDIVVLVEGRCLATGTPRTLGDRGAGTVEVSVALDRPPPAGVVELAAGVERDGGRLVVTTTRPTAVVGELAAWARTDLGLDELPELRVRSRSLEDTYLRLLAVAEASADGHDTSSDAPAGAQP